MKKVIRRILAAAVGVALIASLWWYWELTRGERRERKYPAYSEAVSAAEIRSGFLPKTVPSTSFNIYILSDIDTNQRWVRIGFKDESLAGFQEICDKIGLPDVRFPADPFSFFWGSKFGPENSWWPITFIGGKKNASQIVNGYHFHKCPGNWFAATQFDENVQFYWYDGFPENKD